MTLLKHVLSVRGAALTTQFGVVLDLFSGLVLERDTPHVCIEELDITISIHILDLYRNDLPFYVISVAQYICKSDEIYKAEGLFPIKCRGKSWAHHFLKSGSICRRVKPYIFGFEVAVYNFKFYDILEV